MCRIESVLGILLLGSLSSATGWWFCYSDEPWRASITHSHGVSRRVASAAMNDESRSRRGWVKCLWDEKKDNILFHSPGFLVSFNIYHGFVLSHKEMVSANIEDWIVNSFPILEKGFSSLPLCHFWDFIFATLLLHFLLPTSPQFEISHTMKIVNCVCLMYFFISTQRYAQSPPGN